MSAPLVRPFPTVGERMAQAYYDLYRAETAEKPAQVADLGPLDQLPRPWDLATITDLVLRAEVWNWLDDVVGWINRECVWEAGDMIPSCWPLHPHLVHELGTLADQRRRAGNAFTSDALEDWHRYGLPYFLDRTRTRYRGFCEDGHEIAPGTTRMTRYNATPAFIWRNDKYSADISMIPADSRQAEVDAPDTKPRFEVIDGFPIDTRTGEVVDKPDR